MTSGGGCAGCTGRLSIHGGAGNAVMHDDAAPCTSSDSTDAFDGVVWRTGSDGWRKGEPSTWARAV